MIVADFRPTVGHANTLRRDLEAQLCESYESLLASIESALSMAPGRLRSISPSVSLDHPLASRVYATHWRLGDALESDLPDNIMPALSEMMRGRHDSLGMRIGTYTGDFVDRAADEYLAGKEGQRIQRNSPVGEVLPPDLRGVSDKRLAELTPLVCEATDLIASLDAGMSDEVAQYARELRVVDSHVIGGMSSVRFFGTIFLRQPPPGASNDAARLHFFNGLVHETSHHHLHAVMAVDPLVLNRAERFDSPLRKDKRPMLGIYHATFVLARLAHMFALWNDVVPRNNGVADQLAEARYRLTSGLRTVREHGELTALGAQILESMGTEAAAR